MNRGNLFSEPRQVVAVRVGRDTHSEVKVSMLVARDRHITECGWIGETNGSGIGPGALSRLVEKVIDIADDEETLLAVNQPDSNDVELAVIAAAIFGAGSGLGIPTAMVLQSNPLRGAPVLSGSGETMVVTVARNALWLAWNGYVKSWTEKEHSRKDAHV